VPVPQHAAAAGVRAAAKRSTLGAARRFGRRERWCTRLEWQGLLLMMMLLLMLLLLLRFQRPIHIERVLPLRRQ
jgi:hypothetical protein